MENERMTIVAMDDAKVVKDMIFVFNNSLVKYDFGDLGDRH